MELNDCINFELASAQNAVYHYFKERLAPFDVTPGQYTLLNCLWAEDMQTPTQLAQTLRLDASSITAALARLEKKRLVERLYSQRDRRSISVHLLEGGAALQKPIEQVILEANRQLSAGLDESDYARFREHLHIIEDNAKS